MLRRYDAERVVNKKICGQDGRQDRPRVAVPATADCDVFNWPACHAPSALTKINFVYESGTREPWDRHQKTSSCENLPGDDITESLFYADLFQSVVISSTSTIGGVAKLAAAHCPNERTLDPQLRAVAARQRGVI